MKLNRKVVLVLALLLSVAMATTGTLAYLTDRDSEANVFTIGNVEIDLTEDFEQGAELLPGVNIEKNPTITNTGKNDAWVWMTIAVPEAVESPDASKNLIHWNYLGGTVVADADSTPSITAAKLAEYKELGYIAEDVTLEQIQAGDFWIGNGTDVKSEKINGEKYNVYTFMYNKALAPDEQTIGGPLVKVYLDTHVDVDPDGNMYWVENGVATDCGWNINDNGNPVVYVSAYAIQKDGFKNVADAHAAYNAQWGDNGTEYTTAVSVSTDEAAKEALTADEENIVVSLEADITYDVAAWDKDAMGGDSTKSITIIGNGHTITFNQTNSDWNNIVTKNGAVLTISDATLTNSGHNDGPWNRHDLNFASDVVLTNVTSDKAMAFKAGATLKNVTIADANTSDTYAIWIQPKGQTVTLEGCTIDMLAAADGRGLKIDNQYLAAAEEGKVTLVVKDTTFKTEEKSAILVKTTAGADITLKNVDITAVAADSTNPVWVDEATAAYDDLVVVTGGNKIVEP